MKITAPGIYELSAEAYHRDPCPEPSLSRGIAHLLLTENPRKAHHAHPRLGGGSLVKPNRAMDAGSIVHSLMLGKGADLRALAAVYGPKHERAGKPVTDFATKAAQEERDAIRQDGGIPVLAHQEAELRNCAEAGLEQLRRHPDGADFFAPGRSEMVVAWQEDGLWFRIMVDRLPDDPRAPLYDLKMTELSAAPGSWDRRMQRIYAFQDAFYRRGVRAVRGVAPAPMLFPVTELDAPYCQAVHAAAPSLQAVAQQQVERAVGIWKRCMRAGRWPGYLPLTAWVEATTWQINAEDDQEARDALMETAA